MRIYCITTQIYKYCNEPLFKYGIAGNKEKVIPKPISRYHLLPPKVHLAFNYEGAKELCSKLHEDMKEELKEYDVSYTYRICIEEKELEGEQWILN